MTHAITAAEAAVALAEGRAVVLPTDTVYGLGVAVGPAVDPAELFRLKGRDEGKPVAWLVADPADLDRYGVDVPAYARDLAARLWPGALTLVVPASDAVPPAFRSEAGTIGLRMPASDDALALIRAAGVPLAVTSANPAGEPAPRRAEDVDETLAAACAGVLGGAGAAGGTASTVVDCTGVAPVILREGPLAAAVRACAAQHAATRAEGLAADGAQPASADAGCASAGDAASALAAPVRTPLGFLSADGSTPVRAVLWEPPAVASGDRSRGIVQIVHGMAEHIDRYEDFAAFLVSHGFVVCGHDHLGHGGTAPDPASRGLIDPAAGADALVADVGSLRALVAGRYESDVPYFLFGHSMGSLVLRVYLASHAAGLAGAIICGPAHRPLVVSKAGNLLARAIVALRGADARSNLLHSLADGSYSHQVDDPRTPFDWLTRDQSEVDAFIADEASGFMFSAGAYAALTDLAFRAALPRTFAAVPHDLPVLFIAGDADPVGDAGRGVARAAQSMEAAGVADVSLKLYEGMRHEILNEIGREEVYQDVLAWLDARL